MKDKRIWVVCGGFSSERDISLLSGQAIRSALIQKGYTRVELFDLHRENAHEIITARPDIVFIALHGQGGEDGSIQGFLELAGIPHTGSGICSSAICMDKIYTKRVLENAGLPTGRFAEYRKCEVTDMAEFSRQIIASFGIPLVVKAPCQGSSIGVVIVWKEEELPEAIHEVFKYGDALLVEEYLSGTEVTLPILGNDVPQPLPIIEITSERDFYDFKAKYTSGLCHHIIPACISESTAREVEELGVKAYKMLNCKGLARVDFIIDREKGPMIIEINTMPGMTAMSLFPDAARFAGISFEDLVERILILGFDTKRDLVK